jgi:2,3-bisphosphoglycerate-dependent phosphoglycerate mutase
MKLILIRHGESEGDLLNVHEGRADFQLTGNGRDQARRLAAHLKDTYKIDKIYSSPLLRARETAEIIASEANQDIDFLDGLMEWNNGVLAGMDREEARDKYPEPLGGWMPHQSVENGESMIQFRSRLESVFSYIISQEEFQTIAIVSHGGVLNKMLQAFLQLPFTDDIIFATGDTGYHYIEYRKGKKVFHKINSVNHL